MGTTILRAAAFIALASALVLTWRYLSEQAYARELETEARALKAATWDEPIPLDALDALDTASRTLIAEERYSSPREATKSARRALVTAYLDVLHKALAVPCADGLEAELRGKDAAAQPISGSLRHYLMLRERTHLDSAFAGDRCTAIWVRRRAQASEPLADALSDTLRERMRPHARHYFALIAKGEGTVATLDDDLVGSIRDQLFGRELVGRLDLVLVQSLELERIDDARALEPENRLFPAVVRPQSLNRAGAGASVSGLCTDRGMLAVQHRMAVAEAFLVSEVWVFGDFLRDSSPFTFTHQRASAVAAVAARYVARCTEEWMHYLRNANVALPDDPAAAEQLLMGLGKPDSAVVATLETVRKHTQSIVPSDPFESPEARDAFERVLKNTASSVDARAPVSPEIKEALRRDLLNLGEKFSRDHGRGAVDFLAAPGSGTTSGVDRYAEIAARLAEAIREARTRSRSSGEPHFSWTEVEPDFVIARASLDALLQDYDELARTMLRPLLSSAFEAPGVNR